MPVEITEYPKWVNDILCADEAEEKIVLDEDSKKAAPKKAAKSKKAETDGNGADGS